MKGDLGTTILDDLIMILLALASVFLLIFEVVADLNYEQVRAIQYTDLVISFIFLGEFTFGLVKSKSKIGYFKGHWWELLASIPITNETVRAFRGLRILRIIRLVRLLRLIRFMVRLKILLNTSQRFTKETKLIYIATTAGTLILFASLAFHYFEIGQNPNVHGFWDSFWWAMVTVTTIGYGDIYPVTLGGRIVAIFLMLTGIGTLGVVTATIASYVLKQQKR